MVPGSDLHMSQRNIVIIGNGVTGVTAARHIRKRLADDRITIISGETDHHFSRTALMTPGSLVVFYDLESF